MSNVLELAQALITQPSLTPEDADCQTIISEQLAKMGFNAQTLKFGEVTNLWATHGNGSPCLVFVGHTDVVPTGPLEQWSSPPFTPTIQNGYLYGRGAADMKSSIAAMIVACEKFIGQYPEHPGTIAFLITSDEEGVAQDGTKKVVEWLIAQNEKIDFCLVGEPTSEKELGDTIKNGRRGSLSAKLTFYGKQGHIAYPTLAENPIHAAMEILNKLVALKWDQGNTYFPPTHLQISNIHAGTGAANVIPGHLEVLFNLRYSTETNATEIKNTIQTLLDSYGVKYTLDWSPGSEPYFTEEGKLVEACKNAIQSVTGLKAQLSTSGGTSDGRFMAQLGCEIVELGPCNDTIHKINESVRVDDLPILANIYEQILDKTLNP